MALFETSGSPSLHRSLKNHNSMSTTTPPRYIQLPSTPSITTPHIRPPPVPPKPAKYVPKSKTSTQEMKTRKEGKTQPPKYIQLPSTPPISPTSPKFLELPPSPPPKSPNTIARSKTPPHESNNTSIRAGGCKPPPRLHLRTLLPTPPLSPDFKKSIVAPVVDPWKWRCCACGRGYELGVTRRCLEDGHLFCGSSTLSSTYPSSSSSSVGNSIGRSRDRESIRARRRKCGVDFDYAGWMRWGALRREKRVCELPGSGTGLVESGFGSGHCYGGGVEGLGWVVRRDCWVDCGFLGECGGFRWWLRRERRDGDGDITMRDLDIDVGAGILGGTEYPSNFQIDILRMIDGMLNTGFGESPPNRPLKEEVCWEWNERSQLERSNRERSWQEIFESERSELPRYELERKEFETHDGDANDDGGSGGEKCPGIWNDNFGDLGIREMSEKNDSIENAILAECLRGGNLLVRRCEVGEGLEEMFGDEERVSFNF